MAKETQKKQKKQEEQAAEKPALNVAAENAGAEKSAVKEAEVQKTGEAKYSKFVVVEWKAVAGRKVNVGSEVVEFDADGRARLKKADAKIIAQIGGVKIIE